MLYRNIRRDDVRAKEPDPGIQLGRSDGQQKEATMIGIESPGVWLAYLLSIGGAALCVGYGIVNWNKGEESLKKEDVDWAKEEKEEVEEAL